MMAPTFTFYIFVSPDDVDDGDENPSAEYVTDYIYGLMKRRAQQKRPERVRIGNAPAQYLGATACAAAIAHSRKSI